MIKDFINKIILHKDKTKFKITENKNMLKNIKWHDHKIFKETIKY